MRPREQLYRPSPDKLKLKLKLVDEYMDELFELGVRIVPTATSEYFSVVVMVPKTDGSQRVTFDYRASAQYDYPITPQEIYRSCHGAKLFSSLDVTKAFYNLGLKKSDWHKTTLQYDADSCVTNTACYGDFTAGHRYVNVASKMKRAFEWPTQKKISKVARSYRIMTPWTPC